MNFVPWSPFSDPLAILVLVLAGGLAIFSKGRFGPYPDLPVFLLYGLLIGPILHLVILRPDGIVTIGLTLGAVFILFEGGRGLSSGMLENVFLSIARLAGWGWLITATLITLGAHFLFQAPWALSMLLAVIIANTDPTAVIPIMSGIAIRGQIKTTLEAESAFNDVLSSVAIGVMVTLFTEATSSFASLSTAIGIAFLHIGEGIMVGILMGALGHLLGRRSERWGLLSYVIAPLGCYALLSAIGGNVYLGGFIAGITIRSLGPTPTVDPLWRTSLGGLARIIVFVLLGASFPLAAIATHWVLALGLTVLLIVIARPLTILGSLGTLIPRVWTLRELSFMMWVRETGAVSAVLAAQVAHQFPQWGHLVLAVALMTVMITIGIQVPTTPYWAQRLNILEPPQSPEEM